MTKKLIMLLNNYKEVIKIKTINCNHKHNDVCCKYYPYGSNNPICNGTENCSEWEMIKVLAKIAANK